MNDNRIRNHRNNGATTAERRLSMVLLGILALIAAVMLIVQGRYDPGLWREQARTAKADLQTPSPETTAKSGEADGATGVVPLSSAENYDSANLSDKIDGKADLYLSAGFRGLKSRRFGLAGDKNRWLERYVYDMGGLRNAYAVFSAQRRPNAEPLDLTPYAYLAGNGLFFVHGPFYVEMIAAEASPQVQTGMKALAAAFIASHPAAAENLPELGLFPLDHRVDDNVKLTARGAFGIEGLNDIFTAAYASGPVRALAFAARRPSVEEAVQAVEKFQAFWMDFGGETVASGDGFKEARIILIMDNYEIAMARGPYFFGVHEASDLQFGLALAKELQARIAAQVK